MGGGVVNKYMYKCRVGKSPLRVSHIALGHPCFSASTRPFPLIASAVYLGYTCILALYSLRFSPWSSYRLYKIMPMSNVLEGDNKVLPANYPREVQSESYLGN